MVVFEMLLLKTDSLIMNQDKNLKCDIKNFNMQKKMLMDIPIIAVTANADKATRSKLSEVGMNDYMLKPINAAEIYIKINFWK